MIRRRLTYALLAILLAVQGLSAQDSGKSLPAWHKGVLDIHFISTGCGNCSFCVLPDGTTMLVDAGDLARPDIRVYDRKPDESRSVGEWIADYIEQFSPAGKDTKLDYTIVTHYHDDHIGSPKNAHGFHPQGGYALSGLTEVGTILPIGKLIDRGNDFTTSNRGNLDNYLAFREWNCEHRGMTHETVRIGSSDQVRLLKNPEAYPEFNIRMLFGNGRVADKIEEKVVSSKFKDGDKPGENDLSVGFRLDYGPFRFYSGGDIPGIEDTGATDPESMECRVADLVGHVDVAVMNHHGNRNTHCVEFVSALSPRVWIGECWGIRHPGEETVRRISNKSIYPGPRDIYSTFMAPESKVFLKTYIKEYKSTDGHIVVRVAPGGASYDVYVLDDTTPERNVVMANHYATSEK